MRNIAIGNLSCTGLGHGNIVIGNGACLTDEINTLLIDLDGVKIKAQMSPSEARELNVLLLRILEGNRDNIFVTDPVLN